jgi:aldose 1-epimerase
MKASVTRASFGQLPDGRTADLFTLTNAHGLVAKVTNYGTIITELHVPDRTGQLADVVLGYDNLAAYLKGHPYFGATCGRVANRIAKGRFSLDGKDYQLAANNGPNALHGGLKGFDKVLWQAEPLPTTGVRFSHTSPDGDEGYPGNLTVSVIISLTSSNALVIDYTATTDKATPLNLTNHSYFNLAGHGDILAHELTLAADFYTPVDDTSIPTGEIRAVRGTPFDFTKSAPIGSRFEALGGEPRGYDHNYVLSGDPSGYNHNFVLGGSVENPPLAARVVEPQTGRILEVFTTEPGVQLYTGNWLDGTAPGKGRAISRHSGLCLETQHSPDSANRPHFPSTILRPGQTYRQTTIHRFSAA